MRRDPSKAYAYNDRGLVYQAKGDLDRAIADFTEAIRLDPKSARAFNNRGIAYQAKGDGDRAIADFTEAIRLDPKNFLAYLVRGLAHLYSGSLPQARADLSQASELNPKFVHAALWLDIVNRRSHLPSGLAQAISQLDMTKWPAPVIRLFLGQMTPAAVLDAADDPDAKTKRDHVCDANLYSGELALGQGAKDDASRLLRRASADCPKGSTEWWAANAELKALGANHE